MAIRKPSGGSGLTPEQLAALTTDADLADAVSNIVAQVSGAGAISGEVRLFNNTTGNPPSGWSLTSQSVPTQPMWGSSRMFVLPYRAAANSTLSVPAGSIAGYSAAVSPQHNKLFLFPSTSTGARDVRMWDLGTFAWQKSASVPTTNPVGAFAQSGNYLYTGGGYNTSIVSASLYRYNILTDTWTSLARPGGNSRDWALLPVDGGRVVAAGGVSSTAAPATTNMLAAAQMYDPNTNSWTTKAAAPLAFCAPRSAAMGGDRFFLLPAWVSDGTTLTSYGMLMYDYPQDAWTVVEALPAGYSSPLNVSATGDGRALVFCANHPAGQSCAVAYDPIAPIGSRFAPFDAGDNDVLRYSTSSIATGTCLRDYAGCAYLAAYAMSAALYVPTLVRVGPDVPVSRNFFAIKN